MTITLKKHGGLRFIACGRARVSFCMVRPVAADVNSEERRERTVLTVSVAALLIFAGATAIAGGKLTRPVAASASTLAAAHAFHAADYGLIPLPRGCEIHAIDSRGGLWIAGSGSDAAAAWHGVTLPAGTVDVREMGDC